MQAGQSFQAWVMNFTHKNKTALKGIFEPFRAVLKFIKKGGDEMTVELAVIISVISLIFGIYSGVANLKRNSRNDTKMDQSQLTTVIVKLENIGNDISEMKSDLRDVKEDLKNHSERLVKMEQQIKVLNNAIFGRKENRNEKD